MKKGIWTAIAALILTTALGTGAGVSVPRLLTSAIEVTGTENAIESGLEPTVPIRADLNGDGKVTSADLAHMRRYLAGWSGYEVADQSKFDLDGDSQITGSDVTMLRRYLAEWEVHPEETYTDGLTFEVSADGKSYSVTGYNGGETESLVIPSYYHGLPVTEVKKEVFEALPSVTELTVGDNIATMPDEVKSLTSLTRLTIGNSLESLDVNGYQNLKEVLVSGNNQTYSTQDGVLFDKEKTELIAYPQGKEEQSYQIPETVTAIGENAFANTRVENILYTGTPEEWTKITENSTVAETVKVYYEVPTEEPPEHTHSYVDTVIPATCGMEGYTKHICNCGIYYIDNKTPATGEHSFTNYESNENATCIADGTETATCDNCGRATDTRTAEGSKLEHSFTNYVSNNDATCTADGTERAYCDYGCGETDTHTVEGSRVHRYENNYCVFCGEKKASEGLEYTLSSDGTYYMVTGMGSCTDTELVISSLYNGKPVTSIGWFAFEYCNNLTSVTIPNSVTSIGDYAFEDCSSLTSVTIGNNVTSIGEGSFEYCYKLVEVINKSSLTIEKGSTSNGYVGYYALNVKKSGDSDIVKQDGYLFYTYGSKNYLLGYVGEETNLILPETYRGKGYQIYQYAFSNCSSLTSVTILDSVTSIGSSAFSGCSGLESITLPFVGGSVSASSACPSTLFGYIFGESSYTGGTATKQYYASDSFIVYYIPTGLTTVTITGGKIFYGAFYNCSSLTSVTIPDSVTSIGSSAFSGCSGLESITLPFVGGSASANSAFLSTLFGYIFGGSSYTGGTATRQYYASSSYETYYIPTSLTTVTITGGKIFYGAFYGCSSLTSVTIPNSVTSIGDRAFKGCSSLTSVTIPESVTSIGGDAFYGCSSLTSVHISDIEAWYNISFSDYYANPLSYAKNLYLNGTLVTDLVIPDSATSIGKYAFSGCSSLTSVTIPNSVMSIGRSAFSGCSGLESITLPFVGGSVSATSASSSTLFGYIFGGSSYTGGTATRQYYASSWYETYYIPTGLTTVTITGGKIFYGAFYDCSSLTSVTISDSVTSIGERAFYGCNSLTSVMIPDSVTSIGSDAFSWCTSLTSVTIPDSVTNIGEYAFYNCSSLTSVTIPNSITSLGYCIFYDCSSLTSVTIPESVTSIGGYAFYGCSSLTSVTIPDSVTSIGNYAFYNCNNLTSVTFENSTGWLVSESSTATSGTSIAESELSNSATAARYLSITYCNYYWKRG